jgi:hypothetical protein
MELFFPPFRLDLGSKQLGRADEPIALRHRAIFTRRGPGNRSE